MNNTIKIKISIIIPAYNAEKYISRCIDSWLNQTYSNFELVIINDGSVDNTQNICENYKKQDSRIILINTENYGVSHARNIGLDNVKGDFIGFCDADDYVHPQMLELIYQSYNIYNKNIIVVGYKLVSENSFLNYSKLYNVFNIKNSKFCTAQELASKILYDKKIKGFAWNKFFNKKLILKKFDESISYCEDMHWLINNLIINMNESVIVLNNKLYYYFSSENSATHDKSKFIDEDGQYKYIPAIEKILKMSKNISDLEIECRCTLFEFSAQNILKVKSINENTKLKLKKYICESKKLYFKNKNRAFKSKFKNFINLLFLFNKLN